VLRCKSALVQGGSGRGSVKVERGPAVRAVTNGR
jgi:hypothetical protein